MNLRDDLRGRELHYTHAREAVNLAWALRRSGHPKAAALQQLRFREHLAEIGWFWFVARTAAPVLIAVTLVILVFVVTMSLPFVRV